MNLRPSVFCITAVLLTQVSFAAPISSSADLSAGNRGNNDYYGQAVAISGNTMVVGAPFEDGGNTGINPASNEAAVNAGAAYVYIRGSDGAWTQQAYLKASNTGAGDQFGFSVAISGDTLVVGAFAEASKATGVSGSQTDNTATNAGAAYVFVRSGTVWRQQAYLKASNTQAGDLFGYSVGISGDSIVVGAFGEASANTSEADNSLAQAGAAYVFTRSSGVWTQQDYLKASNPGRTDLFGIAVGISGGSIVVGASGEASGLLSDPTNNSAASSGAAYVFTRSGSVWTQEDYLKASNIGASDLFGRSVAISGDSIIVGAPQEDSSTIGINSTSNNLAADAGAAYVFIRENDAWSQQAYLKASDTAAGDTFGTSVAIDENTAVVGANGKASKKGSAYAFTRAASTWTEQAPLVATLGSGAADNFGAAVAISLDTTVVGAFGEAGTNNALPLSGAAYVFEGLGPQVSEIVVKNSAGSILASGDTVIFSSLPTANDTTQVFTIQNTGVTSLTLTSLTSTPATQFVIDQTGTATSLAAAASTTFQVSLATSPGTPAATLSIISNDPNTPVFTLNLAGKVFSEIIDTDADGLSDYAEYQMRSLGFDWQVKQTSLVTTLKENGSLAGLSVIKLPVPLLTKNPSTGNFTLSIGIQSSQDLKTFAPFPITADQAVFSSGKIELTFPALDNQAFYRLKTE